MRRLGPKSNELHARVVARIRQLAEAKGISVSQLIDHGGFTRSHVYAILNGDQSPTLIWLVRVAEALEVSPFALFEDQPSTKKSSGKRT